MFQICKCKMCRCGTRQKGNISLPRSSKSFLTLLPNGDCSSITRTPGCFGDPCGPKQRGKKSCVWSCHSHLARVCGGGSRRAYVSIAVPPVPAKCTALSTSTSTAGNRSNTNSSNYGRASRKTHGVHWVLYHSEITSESLSTGFLCAPRL